MRKLSKKEQKLSQKPWLTKGIVKSSKTKNKLYLDSLSENPEKVIQYKIFRDKLTHIKELAKQNHYQLLIKYSKHNIKILWKTINDIIRFNKRKANHIGNLLNEKGDIIADNYNIRMYV